MRRNTPFSCYTRALALFKKDENSPEPDEFNALVFLSVNELQLFYLFTKLSGVTDGDYRNLIHVSN